MAILQLASIASLVVGAFWLYQNVWLFLPFGIDKLFKSLEAERDRRLPLLSLEDHERYGDTYGQYSGGMFTILTRDPRNIASLLSGQSSKFDYGNLRRICFGCLLGEGIFTENGQEWKRSRKLLASELQKPKFPPLSIIESHFQDMLRAVAPPGETPSLKDVRSIFYNYTLDTGTELFLGVSTNLLALPSSVDNEGKRFSLAFNKALRWLATRERFKTFAWLVTGPELWSLCSTARDSLENMIIEAQRREMGSTATPFTDFLGRTTDIGKARDELMSLLFAARDSSASLLCWIVYALAREPEVFARLEEEVLSIVGDDSKVPPTDSDLTRMQYLDDVVNECLRLFPAVPINGRICNTTTTLPAGGGRSGEEPILVPKGALVCFSTFGCQRSTKYYGADAMEFRPERWREVDVKTRTRDYTFHPFIGGPRKCLGEDFALKLIKYTVCRLVQCFGAIRVDNFDSQDTSYWQEKIKYQIGLTMSPDDGVHVELTRR
ncbi:cytochrome P450 CYP5202A1 [Astrocystis sublimbata]|nr:cytochrome P450 CYP5202A1 [Astrocystis sublimbata]